MSETQKPVPENQQRLETFGLKWGKLSEDAQEAAFTLSPAEQRTGVGSDYFESMGIPKEAVDELVSSGLAETKSRQEIARQFVEDHQSEVQGIRNRMREDITMKLTDDERSLLQTYDNEDRVSQHEGDRPRFRFTEGAQDFVISQMDEE